ncbi:uncharacterized protein LOC114015937 [Falco cherrug]|uniref:uncharacterized protein LOC114015937 n=1 Tax=Falco cherrug TaxID=345164 RepID=UPI002479D15B|nr:uncharacterized protein LOC114015937 [Falco cherrug]
MARRIHSNITKDDGLAAPDALVKKHRKRKKGKKKKKKEKKVTAVLLSLDIEPLLDHAKSSSCSVSRHHHKGMPMEEGLHTRSLSYQLFPEWGPPRWLAFLCTCALNPCELFLSFAAAFVTERVLQLQVCTAGQQTLPVLTWSIPVWESSGFKSLKERPKTPGPSATLCPHPPQLRQGRVPPPPVGCSPGWHPQGWAVCQLRSLSSLHAQPLGQSLHRLRWAGATLPVPPRTGPTGALPCSLDFASKFCMMC